MNRKTFTANLNPIDPFNCYSKIIINRALAVPIPNFLIITNKGPQGVSATLENPQKHHIYPKKLFPYPANYNTLTIKVSSERHLELHNLIAEEKYAEYEAAIKAESRGTITDNIEQIFLDRIASL